jgi:hypothetical protein
MAALDQLGTALGVRRSHCPRPRRLQILGLQP